MSFSDDISRHVRKYNRRIGAVFRQSVQDMGTLANKPIPKGGNLPVDTGFMRASFAYSLGSMPSGPSKNEGGKTFSDDVRFGAGPVEILGMWNPGDTVFLAWTAEYAPYMSARYGFRDLAAQKWDSIVTKNAQQAKARGL